MLTIGTDPEYILIDRYGGIIPANDFGFFHSTSSGAEIGCDDAGTPVEIRPPPAKLTQVSKLCNDITRILKVVANYCNENQFKIYAGACYQGDVPIGGHIHFGGKEIQEYAPRRDELRTKILKLMDVYFTPITNCFLDTDDLMNRMQNYGRLSSYERKRYGFEYRTPYSFLVSPFFTKAFFSLASLIAYHYRKLKVPEHILYKVHRYYDNLDDRKRLDVIYKMIKPKILKMMQYKSPNPRYNTHITALFSLIERGRQYNDLNVLRNYKLEGKVALKTFEILYSRDEYVRDMESRIKTYISNRSPGKIYLYGVGRREERREYDEDGEPHVVQSGIKETMESTVFLSNSLPAMPVPLGSGIKVVYRTFGNGSHHQYSMGMSYRLRQLIARGDMGIGFLVKYINKLKLNR